MVVTADLRSKDAGQSAAPSVSERFAELIAQTRTEELSSDLLAAAAGLVLDWLGCAIAGLPSAQGQALLRHAEQQPAGPASTLGFSEGRSPQVAALHNGAVSHITEMDDVDRASIIHPGAVVIPAALAVAERLGKPGRELLTSIVVGYEIAIRVGESVGKTHYFHWHNTATCGVFGAAAAAGWLLGLSREQLVWALGNAGTQASGLWQFIQDGTMSKHLHAGRAAANGVLAAELAECGFSGPRQIFEGTQGFWAATAPDGDPTAAVRDLGSGTWKLLGTSIKPYPSCRHTHAAVDAALALRERAGRPRPADIARLDIEGYHSVLDLCDNPNPQSLYAAKFSVHYTTARALLDGHLRLDDFGDEQRADPRVREVMARTTARIDDGLEALYPAQLPARVTLTLADGRQLTEEVLNAKGDPENPLTDAELNEKFVGLLAGTPYAGREQRYVREIRALGERENVQGLLTL